MINYTKLSKRISVITELVNNTINENEAANKLEITTRQVRRLKKRFIEFGNDGLIHKNSGRKSLKKLPNITCEAIVNTYTSDYGNYGFTHYYQDCAMSYGISFSSMVNILTNADIISPNAHRKTVRLYNEKMRKAMQEHTITEVQKEIFESRQLHEEEKHFRKSTLNYQFGSEVQMDAAFYLWFGIEESALHLAVDRATKLVLAGWFDFEETTEAYKKILMNILLNYGIPKLIRTDKRGSFSINNAKKKKEKGSTTQFGRICCDLEIELECNSNPLFKPNVERENGTFKRRLKAELEHNKIDNIDDANKYLNEVFIPKINKLFAYDINPNKNMMRPCPYTKEELDFILSTKVYNRTFDNASSIKYLYNYYIPTDLETKEKVYFKSNTKCTIIITYSGKLYCTVDDKNYKLQIVEKSNDYGASKNGYKPCENHPWKKKFITRL